MANKNLKIGDIIRHGRDLDFYVVTSILIEDISNSEWSRRPAITRYTVDLIHSTHYVSKLSPDSWYKAIFCYEIDNDTYQLQSIEKSEAERQIRFLRLLYE